MKAHLLILSLCLSMTAAVCQDVVRAEPLSAANLQQVTRRSTEDFKRIYQLNTQQFDSLLVVNERFYSNMVKLYESRDPLKNRSGTVNKYLEEKEKGLRQILTEAQWQKFLINKQRLSGPKTRKIKM